MTDPPELLDYVVFFEAEPEWTHGAGWFCGVRFATQRGEDRIVVTLAPDETEFSIDWWQGPLHRLSLRSVMVSRWQIETRAGRETLHLTFDDDRVKYCQLQLKPHVMVDWRMT